jgi:competence protein ComEC
MPAYDIFFFSALFFLLGVLLASFHWQFWILILVATLFLSFLFYGIFSKRRRFIWIGGFSLLMIVGALYYNWHDLKFRSETKLVFNEKVSLVGVIVSNPKISSNVQEFIIDAKDPYRGRVLVKTAVYPRYHYGDQLRLEAIIKPPSAFSQSYARYLEKEVIGGLTSFPKAEVLGAYKASAIKSILFGIRNKIAESFEKILPATEAAFLSGLTLGGMQGLPQTFKEAMRLSGTTHLVALSGYNISIIIAAVMGALAYFFPRRLSFIFATLIILGFVVMTGAEASVVRAAIMGFLVLLAGEVGRLYNFRNAITFAALLMVLQNPKVLAFDTGFQLSFLALLGIIYLKPMLARFLKLDLKNNPGFLSWRENLLTTFSAQVLVAPILIKSFGQFSLTSLLANVLVLELVPVTMFFGFLAAAASLFSYYLSLIFGWVTMPLLKIEIAIIELFAKLTIPFRPQFGLVLMLVYYCLISLFVIYVRRFVPELRKTQK